MAALSVSDAQTVAAKERPEGRQILADYLGWDAFDEEDNLQTGIILDFHYDNLMFCVQKGFPWKQVCALTDLAGNMLLHMEGETITECVQEYQVLCQNYMATVSEQNLKLFTEYFFETFMRHFRLYQHVLYTERDQMKLKADIDVETPAEPLPFTDSKHLTQWEYEQKVRHVEEEEENTKAGRMIKEEEDNRTNHDNLRETTHELQQAEQPVENERLSQMIEKIAASHVSSASHAIKNNICNSIEDLGFMLQKTALPRPQEMGPPPRYKTRTPLGGGAAKQTKSRGKTDSREKSSGSRGASRAAKAK